MITRLGCSLSFLGEPGRPGGPGDLDDCVGKLREWGYESLWTSEAYGADCFTPLAWWGSHASGMRLGTAVAQMAARTPAAAAMAAITLDRMSGGQVVLGLGVSGPQVVEGWYGLPFEQPLQWTREYVEILRLIWQRASPVAFNGRIYQLPTRRGTGLGKALRSSQSPERDVLPIYLGAEGPKNIALAAEIADGWLATNFSPTADAFYRECLAEGLSRRRDGGHLKEVAASVSVAVGSDVESCADRLRPRLALYAGGMGAKEANFHLSAFSRLGFGEVCREIQDRFLNRDREGAAAAVPTEMVEAVALVGPPDKIEHDLRRWDQTVATTLIVRGEIADCEAIAEVVRRSPERVSEMRGSTFDGTSGGEQ